MMKFALFQLGCVAVEWVFCFTLAYFLPGYSHSNFLESAGCATFGTLLYVGWMQLIGWGIE